MEKKTMYTRIMAILKEEEEYKEAARILDYELCSSVGTDHMDYEDIRDIYAVESYGGSEGIYVDVYAKSKNAMMFIITFKTLDADKDAWMTMGKIAALAGWAAHKAEWD